MLRHQYGDLFKDLFEVRDAKWKKEAKNMNVSALFLFLPLYIKVFQKLFAYQVELIINTRALVCILISLFILVGYQITRCKDNIFDQMYTRWILDGYQMDTKQMDTRWIQLYTDVYQLDTRLLDAKITSLTRWILDGYQMDTRWIQDEIDRYQMDTRCIQDEIDRYQMDAKQLDTRWILNRSIQDGYKIDTRWILNRSIQDGYKIDTRCIQDGYKMDTRQILDVYQMYTR